MSYNNLLVELSGNLATITFNRPKVLNALNTETMLELGKAVTQIGENRELRGVILTGAGEKAFIAGADIGEFTALTPSKARDLAHLGQRVTRAMEALPFPVLAAVNGFALGGGFEMALACDFIFASENAKLGLPEVTLGIIPGWGGTQRLARLIGPNRARQLVFSGAKVSAQEAKTLGIVNEVFPQSELLTKSRELLTTIAANSPFAVAQAKRSLNEGLQGDLDRGLMLEQTFFGLCFAAEDLKEGVAAFQEKRKPAFTGKSLMPEATPPPRILIAKPGLDGHDRGAKVVARALRDAGFEVIYTGRHQTSEMIVRAASQEDVDAIGISILSGAHNRLFPEIIDRLKKDGLSHVLVFGGGIIPKEDISALKKLGVAEIFIPGTDTNLIVDFVREKIKPRKRLV